MKFELLCGTKTMNSWHDSQGSLCPGVFATRVKCFWRLKGGKGGKVLTLLQEDISKQSMLVTGKVNEQSSVDSFNV